MKSAKDKTPRYRIETYRDKYKTLSQSIVIDLEEEKESEGKYKKIIRGKIKPNLELYEEIIEKKDHQEKKKKKVD